MFNFIRRFANKFIFKDDPSFSAKVEALSDGIVRVSLLDNESQKEHIFDLDWQELAACVDAVLTNRELVSWMCISPDFAESLAGYLYERSVEDVVQ